MDNYKKWAREMQYSLEFVGIQDYTLLSKENPKLVSIISKDKELKADVKLEYQEKCANKIIVWIKNNVKYKDYIGRMYFGHIQQKF